MKACASCGTDNLDDARFCDHCGQPFQSVAQRPPTINVRAPKGFITSAASGEIFALLPDREMMIGRGDPSRDIVPDITLKDEEAVSSGVSRIHAKILCEGNKFYISDLNSTNSTYLNGEKLPAQQPALLHDGDEIELGRYLLRLKLG